MEQKKVSAKYLTSPNGPVLRSIVRTTTEPLFFRTYLHKHYTETLFNIPLSSCNNDDRETRMTSESKSHSASALAACPDLDDTNWVEFDRRMHDVLVNKNYLYSKVLDGSTIRPVREAEEAVKDFTARLDKWEELQIQGRSAIRSKLGPTALVFSETHGTVKVDGKDEYDLKQLREQLKEEFRPKGVATFHRLQTLFLGLRLDEFSSVAEFNNEFIRVDGELKLLSEKTQLPGPWMVGMYLNQLPSAYDTFKSNWVSQHDYVDASTSQTALAELMAATRKEEQLMQHSSGRTALLSHGGGGVKIGGDGNPAVQCSFCKKYYHEERDCVDKYPHLKAALDKRLEKRRAGRGFRRDKQKEAKKEREEPTPVRGQFAIRGRAAFQPPSGNAFEIEMDED